MSGACYSCTGDFGPERTAPHAVPLEQILLLEQAVRARKETVTAASAAARLTACAPFINRDPHRQETLLDTLQRLVSMVSVLRLGAPEALDLTTLMDASIQAPAYG